MDLIEVENLYDLVEYCKAKGLNSSCLVPMVLHNTGVHVDINNSDFRMDHMDWKLEETDPNIEINLNLVFENIRETISMAEDEAWYQPDEICYGIRDLDQLVLWCQKERTYFPELLSLVFDPMPVYISFMEPLVFLDVDEPTSIPLYHSFAELIDKVIQDIQMEIECKIYHDDYDSYFYLLDSDDARWEGEDYLYD
uniref:Uncharacterized protein n=1 Tax=Melon chlorotic spot virus TaxID=2479459 RepID=A0A481T0C6_9VIRU|nr:hypothetical protein [Melon chlorotic spot virus]